MRQCRSSQVVPSPAISELAQRRVLPMPASPVKSTTWPRPASSSCTRRGGHLLVAADEDARGGDARQRCNQPRRTGFDLPLTLISPIGSSEPCSEMLRGRVADDDRSGHG